MSEIWSAAGWTRRLKLAQHKAMTLATIRPDGFLQATMVYYANDGLVLYFATDLTSQKASNIQLNRIELVP